MDLMGTEFKNGLVAENRMASLVGKNQKLVAKFLVMRMMAGYK